MTKQIQYGYIADEIKPEDYVFGSNQIAGVMLQPDGQWDEFLPEIEMQYRNGLETSNCTVYGTLNCIEILFRRVLKLKRNYCERYVGVMAETTMRGNSPHKVAETVRKVSGLIDEDLLPFDETIRTWQQYYSPDPMKRLYLRLGESWLKAYNFKHEWVFRRSKRDNTQTMVEALRFSPLGVSVYAWAKKGDLYYKPAGMYDNHWCTVYGYKRGEYWKVFDHYDDTHKKLVWDFDFGSAKRFYIERKSRNPSVFCYIIQWIKSLFS